MYIKSMLSTCFSDNLIVSVPGSMQRLSLKALTCHSGIREGCAGIAAKTTCCSGWGHCTLGTQGMLQPMGRLFLTFVGEIRILLFIGTWSCPLTCQIYTARFCTDVKRFLQNFTQYTWHLFRQRMESFTSKWIPREERNWNNHASLEVSKEDRQWFDRTFFWAAAWTSIPKKE